MKNLYASLAILFGMSCALFAQQDPMFTKYSFVPLAYNPAYAGSAGYATFSALYRKQWFNLDGAPQSQVITAHTPIKDNIGLGFSAYHDGIGARSNSGGSMSYAYIIGKADFKVSVGLQASIVNISNDWSILNHRDDSSQDYAFSQSSENNWLPNFGVGLYIHSPNFFVGVSVPSLIEHNLRTRQGGENIDTPIAQQYRHLYLTGGLAVKLNHDFTFRPLLLIKNVGILGSTLLSGEYVQAPTEFDVDLSIIYQESIWLGMSLRSSIESIGGDGGQADSFDIWGAYSFSNGLKLGFAYDYLLSPLQNASNGSMEVLLSFDLSQKKKKIYTPRYF